MTEHSPVEKLQIKFFYPTKKIVQHSLFEGVPDQLEVVPVGVGHIVHGDSQFTLCDQLMNDIVKEVGATHKKLVEVRLHNVQLCEFCVEIYKKMPGSLWYQWEKAVKNDGS